MKKVLFIFLSLGSIPAITHGAQTHRDLVLPLTYEPLSHADSITFDAYRPPANNPTITWQKIFTTWKTDQHNHHFIYLVRGQTGRFVFCDVTSGDPVNVHCIEAAYEIQFDKDQNPCLHRIYWYAPEPQNPSLGAAAYLPTRHSSVALVPPATIAPDHPVTPRPFKMPIDKTDYIIEECLKIFGPKGTIKHLQLLLNQQKHLPKEKIEQIKNDLSKLQEQNLASPAPVHEQRILQDPSIAPVVIAPEKNQNQLHPSHLEPTEHQSTASPAEISSQQEPLALMPVSEPEQDRKATTNALFSPEFFPPLPSPFKPFQPIKILNRTASASQSIPPAAPVQSQKKENPQAASPLNLVPDLSNSKASTKVIVSLPKRYAPGAPTIKVPVHITAQSSDPSNAPTSTTQARRSKKERASKKEEFTFEAPAPEGPISNRSRENTLSAAEQKLIRKEQGKQKAKTAAAPIPTATSNQTVDTVLPQKQSHSNASRVTGVPHQPNISPIKAASVKAAIRTLAAKNEQAGSHLSAISLIVHANSFTTLDLPLSDIQQQEIINHCTDLFTNNPANMIPILQSVQLPQFQCYELPVWQAVFEALERELHDEPSSELIDSLWIYLINFKTRLTRMIEVANTPANKNKLCKIQKRITAVLTKVSPDAKTNKFLQPLYTLCQKARANKITPDEGTQALIALVETIQEEDVDLFLATFITHATFLRKDFCMRLSIQSPSMKPHIRDLDEMLKAIKDDSEALERSTHRFQHKVTSHPPINRFFIPLAYSAYTSQPDQAVTLAASILHQTERVVFMQALHTQSDEFEKNVLTAIVRSSTISREAKADFIKIRKSFTS